MDNSVQGNIRWANNLADLKDLSQQILEAETVVFDLETTGLDEHAWEGGPKNGGVEARIVLATFTLNPEGEDTLPRNWIVPLSHPESLLKRMWRKASRYLATSMSKSRGGLVGHNVKYDARYLFATTAVDLSERIVWDTVMGSRLMDENTSAKLKERVPEVFGVQRWDDVDLTYPGAAEDVPLQDLGRYAVQDTYWTWMLLEHQRSAMSPLEVETPEDVELARLRKLATWTAMPTVSSLARMEMRGIKLDRQWVENTLKDGEEIAEEISSRLARLYPEMDPGKASFAPTANWFRQWADLAVERGDLVIVSLTRTGKPQWTKQVLSKLSGQGYEVAADLLRMRKHSKKNEFLRSWLEQATRQDTIHSNYSPGGAVSGRLTSSNPNMQQCLLGDAEVLTPSGWVRFDRLRDGMKIVQSDENGRASFVVPEVVRKDFDGEGVRINSAWLDMWTTPDHRVLTYTRDGHPVWERAQEWVGRADTPKIVDRKFRRAVRIEQGSVADRETLRLAVAVSADGSSSGSCWQVTVHRERKRVALRDMGGEDKTWGGRELTCLRVRKSSISEWVDEDRNLRIEKILSLRADDLEWLVDEAMQWDGDSTRGRTFKQNGKREPTVTAVQTAAALCGRSTNRYEHRVNGKAYPTVNVHEKAMRHASRVKVSKERYRGTVYCVRVPKGAFITRVKGTVVVTGNCAKELRPAFVPRPGRVIADLDYSQIEMRMAAQVSGCRPMIEAFQRGDDLHAMLAANVARKPVEEVTPGERQSAKAGNFGLLFGMGPEGFQTYAEEAYGVTLTYDEAVRVHRVFFETWDGIGQWHTTMTRRVNSRGQVSSLIGRVRRLTEVWDGNDVVAARAERMAINAPVQGLASDLMQMSIAWIQGLLPGTEKVEGAYPVATVHDSVVVEADEDNWREILIECKRRMIEVVRFAGKLDAHFEVPIDVEGEVGTRWGLKDIGTV